MDGLAITIEHAALDLDALARNIRRDEIVGDGRDPLDVEGLRRQGDGEIRTDGLRRRKDRHGTLRRRWGLVAAAHHDIEPVGERPIGHGSGKVKGADQPHARALVGD